MLSVDMRNSAVFVLPPYPTAARSKELKQSKPRRAPSKFHMGHIRE